VPHERPVPRPYDLEQRTELFAREVRVLVKKLPLTLANREDIRQLVRASGSVGANYIEANEALSRKDFAMRARISRKEAKEAAYWLRLVDVGSAEGADTERWRLEREARELMLILSAIIHKATAE
jgi:four helix bundle protein